MLSDPAGKACGETLRQGQLGMRFHLTFLCITADASTVQMKLLPHIHDVPGVLQPLYFGPVRGVLHGAVFPYIYPTLTWDQHLASAVGRETLFQLWRRLLEVRVFVFVTIGCVPLKTKFCYVLDGG